jgi:hypothetical protein
MSFRECIVNAQAEGTITEAQAKEARDLLDELEEQYQGKMGSGPASSQAARDTFDALERQAFERKRKKLLTAKAWQQVSFNMNQYKDRLGRSNPFAAAIAHLEQDGMSRFSSVTQREDAIKGMAFAEINKVLGTFRRNLVGEVRQKAQLKNMVREIFGESTGDVSAKEMGTAVTKANETLRKKFNRAGGSIAKNEKFYLPTNHNNLKITKAGYEDWRAKILPKISPNDMRDQLTGLAFTPQRLELALKDVYESITTEGANKMTPGSGGRGKSLANQRQDHRFLVFKDADSWLEYQREFGDENVFDTIVSHISNMSRDIAMMEVLGPNPTATITFMKDTLTKQAKMAKDEGLKDKARSTGKRLDDMYMAVSGRNNSPINSKFASTMAGTRQVLQSAQLGAASISAVTDVNFQRLARQFAGLPQTGILKDYLKYMSPLGAKAKGELAISSGLIAEGWTSLAAGQMRFVGDMSGPEVTRRISDFIMRASFLSPMTSAGRWAFGMEFMGTVARNAGKTFDELDPNFRSTMERYNIQATQWDIIRRTEPYDEKGAKFIRPTDIAARTDIDEALRDNISTRLLEMINTETNFAVPSTSVRGSTFLTGGTQPGTLTGEMARSFAMYKNFGVTLVNTHLMRGMQLPQSSSKGAYYSNLLISTTLMGALALQMKEISKGRDPREMVGDSEETAKFWFAAFMQGGGLGIFGDFLTSATSRYGSGIAETIAGPVAGAGQDVLELTIGNLYQAATGQDTNAASELVKFTQRYTPGSSLWYGRLALERGLWDQMQLMADPKAKTKFRRLESRIRKETGQRYWWGPGDTTPSRKPEISRAFE